MSLNFTNLVGAPKRSSLKTFIPEGRRPARPIKWAQKSKAAAEEDSDSEEVCNDANPKSCLADLDGTTSTEPKKERKQRPFYTSGVKVEVLYNGQLYQEHRIIPGRRCLIPFGSALLTDSSTTKWSSAGNGKPVSPKDARALRAGARAEAKENADQGQEQVNGNEGPEEAAPAEAGEEEKAEESQLNLEMGPKTYFNTDHLTLSFDLPGGHYYHISFDGLKLRPILTDEEKRKEAREDMLAKLDDQKEEEEVAAIYEERKRPTESKQTPETSVALRRTGRRRVSTVPKDEETDEPANMSVDTEEAAEAQETNDGDDPGTKGECPWVACDRCGKWRRLPMSVDPDELPNKWYCEMNVYDRQRNSCDMPQQSTRDNATAGLTINRTGKYAEDHCSICLESGLLERLKSEEDTEPEKGFLLSCGGPCWRSFHSKCAELETKRGFNGSEWYCQDCINESHACFACKEVGKDGQVVSKCTLLCGKYYHQACGEIHQDASRSSTRRSRSTNEVKQAPCPLHMCRSCHKSGTNKNLLKCMVCPTSFHNNSKCRPEELQLIGKKSFICSTHDLNNTGAPARMILKQCDLITAIEDARKRREVMEREVSKKSSRRASREGADAATSRNTRSIRSSPSASPATALEATLETPSADAVSNCPTFSSASSKSPSPQLSTSTSSAAEGAGDSADSTANDEGEEVSEAEGTVIKSEGADDGPEKQVIGTADAPDGTPVIEKEQSEGSVDDKQQDDVGTALRSRPIRGKRKAVTTKNSNKRQKREVEASPAAEETVNKGGENEDDTLVDAQVPAAKQETNQTNVAAEETGDREKGTRKTPSPAVVVTRTRGRTRSNSGASDGGSTPTSSYPVRSIRSSPTMSPVLSPSEVLPTIKGRKRGRLSG